MIYCVFLRGVTPKGPNSIPKMTELIPILEEVGFQQVSTYIQSGNILLTSDLSPEQIADLVHRTILEQIRANLAVIVKTKADLEMAVAENPFSPDLELSRIHLTFTNHHYRKDQVDKLQKVELVGEILEMGSACFYLYLPREAAKKRLNNNLLEKKLEIVATTRKLTVVQKLIEKMEKEN